MDRYPEGEEAANSFEEAFDEDDFDEDEVMSPKKSQGQGQMKSQVQGGKKVAFPGQAGHDGPQYTFHLQRSKSNMLTDQELQDLIKCKQMSKLPLPNHLGQKLKKLTISPHTQNCISATATDSSLNCPVTTNSDVRPCTQYQKSSKPQMNAKKRKCEDAVQHHTTLTLLTPRPAHHQNKLKDQYFSPNTTNMQNYQMSTGINAKWHTQKKKEVRQREMQRRI
jgi:hypothetical protein